MPLRKREKIQEVLRKGCLVSLTMDCMDYDEAISYIHGTLKFGSKLGLHNISVLLKLMGEPHKKLKFIHIGGTNGKGSVTAYISSILMEAGYKTGTFTSPYIQRFTERIKVNREEIGKEDLGRITSFVRKKVEEMLAIDENHPTEFEIVTAIAMQYYMEMDCDVVVLEVGLGGRFDSTNVIDRPELAIITSISYDHGDILGDTLQKIAFEKAGIIKQGGDVLIYPQPPEAETVISQVCVEKGATLYSIDPNDIEEVSFDLTGQVFNYKGYKGFKIALLGGYQAWNAALAVAASELLIEKGFTIKREDIINGLQKARWPGRMEVLLKEPVFIIDGAHNLEGAKALSRNISKYFPDKKLSFIIGMLKDKDYKGMIEAVVPNCRRVIAVTPDSPRALPAAELAETARIYCKEVLISDTIIEAVEKSLELATREELICAFGSLYYIGKVRDAFGL